MICQTPMKYPQTLEKIFLSIRNASTKLQFIKRIEVFTDPTQLQWKLDLKNNKYTLTS